MLYEVITRLALKIQTVKSNPQLELVSEQISELKRVLKDNVNNLLETNSITREEIEEQISFLDKEIMKLPFNERKMIRIKRKFDRNNFV